MPRNIDVVVSNTLYTRSSWYLFCGQVNCNEAPLIYPRTWHSVILLKTSNKILHINDFSSFNLIQSSLVNPAINIANADLLKGLEKCYLRVKKNAMALFQSVQKCYQTLGIYARLQSNRNAPKLNWKNLFFLTCYSMMFISSVAYILFEAKMIGEIADSIFMCLTSLTCAVYFVSSIYKIPKILDLIGEFEKFIEKSEFSLKISI